LRILFLDDSDKWDKKEHSLAETIRLLEHGEKNECFLATPEGSEIHEYFRDHLTLLSWKKGWLRSGLKDTLLTEFIKKNFIDVIHCLSNDPLEMCIQQKRAVKLLKVVFEPTVYLPDMDTYLCRALRESHGLDACVLAHAIDAEHLFLAGGDPQKIHVIERKFDAMQRCRELALIYENMYKTLL
jgi:hypothetical protein